VTNKWHKYVKYKKNLKKPSTTNLEKPLKKLDIAGCSSYNKAMKRGGLIVY